MSDRQGTVVLVLICLVFCLLVAAGIYLDERSAGRLARAVDSSRILLDDIPICPVWATGQIRAIANPAWAKPVLVRHPEFAVSGAPVTKESLRRADACIADRLRVEVVP
jgi:hypothetical protein